MLGVVDKAGTAELQNPGVYFEVLIKKWELGLTSHMEP